MTDLTDFLRALDFEQATSDRWERHFDDPAKGEYIITVDTAKHSIDYPKPIRLGDHTTSNFDHPENFVVLECVCRLLTKGYDPATLILEKRYQVGRGASGGKSDITILHRTPDPAEQEQAPPLLIIECKTFGAEHEIERLKTLQDGGQLFGYLQQDRSATHVCLYSSRLAASGDGFEYRSDIIQVTDSPEAREKFARKEKADSHTAARQAIPLFEHAHNRETLHHAWKTTYGGVFHNRGIFEDEFTPYAVGYTPRRGRDLKEFNGENGSTRVFSQFMEILRHNNVSDKENAFNRLCAIILAKLVDEGRDPDSLLDFQWFPNKDTSEDLIDRLQRLYKRGMKDALGEDITYFEERDIDDAFRAHRRDMAKNEVKKIFRALKFYTNSDFAFKEVHNKKLFEQNTQVVREVVELFQDYRLKYTSKQAFLGNLFELLLNSGFKQSEGQFFTPIPIARFIVRCLPLRERIAAAHESGAHQLIPRVMDYACGSAHFLTEIIEEIQDDLTALDLPPAVSTTWTRDHIWGIEKDYRLARTAKIALFLHGAGDANILHEDGLDHANPQLPKPGALDVLVANPPYSVKDFKQHLQLQGNAFSLLPHLTANSSEIETLFVERAAQLLAVGGMAGLILPASILSNAGIYQRTRTLLLERFLIRGIVELGGSAFIATGTNTVILFLERRRDTDLEHLAIRADALFDEDKCPSDEDYADSDLLRAYCAAAGPAFEPYLQWLGDPGGEPPPAIATTALFDAYQREFDDLAETKRRREQKRFKALSPDEQHAELRGKFLLYCRAAEKTKFIYFALAHVACFDQAEMNAQFTTVLRAGESKAEAQSFLGYKWSQRRGSEGMVFLREPFDGGRLYTPETDSREEPADKAAHHLRHAFLGTEPDDVPEDSPLAARLRTVPTSAYFDFTRTGCDLVFQLSPRTLALTLDFETRYPPTSLGKIVEINPAKNFSDLTDETEVAFIDMAGISDQGFVDKIELRPFLEVRSGYTQFCAKDVLLAKITPCMENGKIAYLHSLPTEVGFGSTEFFVLRARHQTTAQYVYHHLNSEAFRKIAAQAMTGASGHRRVPKSFLESLPIPLPPLEIQQKIISAIELVETAEITARETLANAKQSIDALIFGRCTEKRRIEDVCRLVTSRVEPRETPDAEFLFVGLEHIESETGRLLQPAIVKGRQLKSTKTAFKSGDVLYGKLRPYLNKVACVDMDGVCSTDILVLRSEQAELLQKMLLRNAFVESARARMKGANHPRIGVSEFMQTEIPWPTPEEQASLLAEIASYESLCAQAEAEIAAAPAKKRQILLDGLK